MKNRNCVWFIAFHWKLKFPFINSQSSNLLKFSIILGMCIFAGISIIRFLCANAQRFTLQTMQLQMQLSVLLVIQVSQSIINNKTSNKLINQLIKSIWILKLWFSADWALHLYWGFHLRRNIFHFDRKEWQNSSLRMGIQPWNSADRLIFAVQFNFDAFLHSSL